MSSAALNLVSGAEPALMAVALWALLRSKERSRFPALFSYFSLRLASWIVLYALLHLTLVLPISKPAEYACYFYTYWAFYLASAIAIFFVIQEMFKFALNPLPGLRWLGGIAFRWVACISFVGAISGVLAPGGKGFHLLLAVVVQIMRCESVFNLCLLLFLVLAAGKLGLTYRSRVFGVSFGFGVMAANDLVVSASYLHFATNMMTSTLSAISSGASLLTLTIWCVYFIQKEPARAPAALPVRSPLLRWNEIAIELGGESLRAAEPSPASEFFLQDVEKVVDRILTKNALKAVS